MSGEGVFTCGRTPTHWMSGANGLWHGVSENGENIDLVEGAFAAVRAMDAKPTFAELTATDPACPACKPGAGQYGRHSVGCYVSRRLDMTLDERAEHDRQIDGEIHRLIDKYSGPRVDDLAHQRKPTVPSDPPPEASTDASDSPAEFPNAPGDPGAPILAEIRRRRVENMKEWKLSARLGQCEGPPKLTSPGQDNRAGQVERWHGEPDEDTPRRTSKATVRVEANVEAWRGERLAPRSEEARR